MINTMAENRLGWFDVRLKPSGKWEARWTESQDGKVVTRGRSFNTKEQARKFARDRANGAVDVAVGLAPSKKPIEQAIEAFYLAKVRKDSSNALYERHFTSLLKSHPEISDVNDLTDSFFVKYIAELMATGNHNPGGINQITKTFRAFAKFCLKKKWLGFDPFLEIPRAKTEKGKGRALTPEEFERMIAVGNEPIDIHLNRALRFGNATMLRISMVWKLTPKDFREPNQLWVEGIKGQPDEWKTLHPDAVAILRELPPCGPDERLFGRPWVKVDYMRKAVRYKADRSGLQGVRFHDASKVSKVTELSLRGYSTGELAHISNTSKATLDRYYIKADKVQAVNRYVTDQTEHRPKTAANSAETRSISPSAASIPNDKSSTVNGELEGVRR